jgi:hypothetical protein
LLPVEKIRSVYASFFFVDIVGLSDPELSVTLQVKKIEFLNSRIAECDAFKSVPEESMLILPTGDGMAIGYLQGPELPLRLAIELHEKLYLFNRGKLPNETIQIRIGINSGPVFMVKDIRGNTNIWGPGIIMARRIMDVGDDGHILLSSRVAEDLRLLSHEYEKIIHPLDKITIKHDIKIMVYSAHGKNFGNPEPPAKIKSKMNEFLYPWIVVGVTVINSGTMRVQYKRTYELQNLSEAPMLSVSHQIATDVEKSLNDLNIKVYDERNRPLTITNIRLNTPHQKLFDTDLARPLLQEEKLTYTLEYEVEEPERYFENAFYVNCEKFILIFDSPEDQSIKPILFEVNHENEQKELIQSDMGETRQAGRLISRWQIDNVSKGRSLRVEW